MFTPEYIENVIIEYLTGPLGNLVPQHTGDITRADERNGDKDGDITVTTLNITDGPLQLGACNVSIYLKDIQRKSVDGESYNYLPNTPEFDRLTSKIIEALGGNHGKYWKHGNLYPSNTSPKFRIKERDEHFLSIRVQFRLKGATDIPNY